MRSPGAPCWRTKLARTASGTPVCTTRVTTSTAAPLSRSAVVVAGSMRAAIGSQGSGPPERGGRAPPCPSPAPDWPLCASPPRSLPGPLIVMIESASAGAACPSLATRSASRSSRCSVSRRSSRLRRRSSSRWCSATSAGVGRCGLAELREELRLDLAHRVARLLDGDLRQVDLPLGLEQARLGLDDAGLLVRGVLLRQALVEGVEAALDLARRGQLGHELRVGVLARRLHLGLELLHPALVVIRLVVRPLAAVGRLAVDAVPPDLRRRLLGRAHRPVALRDLERLLRDVGVEAHALLDPLDVAALRGLQPRHRPPLQRVVDLVAPEGAHVLHEVPGELRGLDVGRVDDDRPVLELQVRRAAAGLRALDDLDVGDAARLQDAVADRRQRVEARLRRHARPVAAEHLQRVDDAPRLEPLVRGAGADRIDGGVRAGRAGASPRRSGPAPRPAASRSARRSASRSLRRPGARGRPRGA